MKKLRLNSLIILLLCTLLSLLAGCAASPEPLKPAELNEKQLALANVILERRSLWEGCRDIGLYRYNGEYYFAVNWVVHESYVSDFWNKGDTTKVESCKTYFYHVIDGRLVDDLTLGKEAGVSSMGQKLKSVFLSKNDTAEEEWARITWIAQCYQ